MISTKGFLRIGAFIALVGVFLLFLPVAAFSQTINTFTDQPSFAAAAPNLTTIDFASLLPPGQLLAQITGAGGVTVDGVQFQGLPTNFLYVVAPGYSAPYQGWNGNPTVLQSLAPVGTTLVVTLPSGTTAVGTYIYTIQGTTNPPPPYVFGAPVPVDVTLASGQTQTFTVQTFGPPTLAFVGFTSTSAIASLVFHAPTVALPGASAGGYVNLANLSFASAQTWTLLAPTGGPPSPRGASGAAYDSATNQMIIFAGQDNLGNNANDVWTLSLGATPQWIQLSPAGSLPAGRLGPATAYDGANSRMIVFGGGLGHTSPCVNDVWVLANANSVGGTPTWTQLSPSGTGPAPRWAASAIYVPASNTMTLFGGNDCFRTRFNDVWVLSNANGLGGTPVWTQLSPSGTPPPITNFQTAVYDQASNRMILYGINPDNPLGSNQDAPTNQVWVLTNANGLGGTPTWMQLSPSAPGPVKTDQATVYDPSSNTMIVFGGYTPGATSGTYVFTNDTWVLSNANGLGGTPSWTQLNPSGGPPAVRASMATVYDPATKRMIIFGGGNSTSSFNDVWTLTVAATSDSVPPVTLASLSPQPNGAGWNNADVTVTLNSTDNEPNGTGVKQIIYSATGAQPIASTTVSSASASFIIGTEGITTMTFSATDNAANVEAAKSIAVQLDKTPPSVNCGAADGLWHASDVSIPCTASDAISGLASLSDSSFSLATNVPVGTETSSAATGAHSVCDVAGNCSTAGPVVGNMVDKKPPSINVSSPAAGGSYLLNQVVNANYACTDGGSGVASCTGTVASGSPISTAPVGSKSFTVNATDNVGNVAPLQSVSYSVTYAVCLLYDPTRSVKSGSPIPLRIQLCDTNNADVSSSSVVVHGVSLVQASTNASEVIQTSGNANPDNDFRFDSTLGPTGGYIFNLSTKGLTTGTYQLTFTAGADTLRHVLTFQVR